MNTKNNLRKQTLKKRNSLLEKERLDAEKSLFQSWNAIKDSYKTDKVALYWALNKLTANKETQLIVLAYDFQEVESCMPEAHDIKADACLTPNKFLEFKD